MAWIITMGIFIIATPVIMFLYMAFICVVTAHNPDNLSFWQMLKKFWKEGK